MNVRWCTTHNSVVIRSTDDPDTYWLCAVSNTTGDTADCVIVDAEVIWESE